jgi:hypothetical protein
VPLAKSVQIVGGLGLRAAANANRSTASCQGARTSFRRERARSRHLRRELEDVVKHEVDGPRGYCVWQ